MLLEIKDLHISYKKNKVVKGVHLCLKPGEVVGLVGPSGSGKSTIAQGILGMLPSKPERGEIILNGENLLEKTPLEMERKRGNEIGLINQNVMTSLHPTMTIGAQIIETIRHHKKLSYKEAKASMLILLEKVSLSPSHHASYPHELSGGMRQRAMIAMAICCEPSLLIADEPTTALDVTIQAQIIALLKELKISILFITHDLKLVTNLCDRIYVMNEGEIIESGTVEEVFYTPHHLVTQQLLSIHTSKPLEPIVNNKLLLEAEHLTKKYHDKTVVEDVSFSLQESETLALIGESGCGKSTLGKMIAGLLPQTDGKTIHQTKNSPQMIFQDPYGSLNPCMRVKEIIAEGLEIHRLPNKEKRVEELLTQVQLPLTYLNRYPRELSGGEKQRVGIARALSVNPKLLICDEPLSSLDPITQGHMIELFAKLQKELSLSYLFISHDLLLMKQIAHRIIVMHQGKIVEQSTAEELFAHPQHPYTRELLSSIPSTNPHSVQEKQPLGTLTPCPISP